MNAALYRQKAVAIRGVVADQAGVTAVGDPVAVAVAVQRALSGGADVAATGNPSVSASAESGETRALVGHAIAVAVQGVVADAAVAPVLSAEDFQCD